VEKLCYVLWKPAAASGDAFRDALVGDVGPALLAGDARAVSVLAADAEAEAVARARITRMTEPIAGMLSVWVDRIEEQAAVEAALAPHVARLAGYHVEESIPLANTRHPAPRGARTPGTTMLALLEKPERLPFEEWLAIWHGSHSPLAIEIQATFRYVRNVVRAALTLEAPPWRGIVEEAFPTEAVTDLQRWYRAKGDPEKTRERIGQMVASVQRFLDLDRVESHPLGEYVLRAPEDA
jgi:hypothetical protein